jgi:hypothetical protein
VTFDAPGTEDRDDALSLRERADGALVLGVHVTDTTRLPSELYAWAAARVASAYPCGRPPVHLLPAAPRAGATLAAGARRACLSLYLTFPDAAAREPASAAHAFDDVDVAENATYEELGRADGRHAALRALLARAAREEEPEALVAWAMTRYNLHFAAALGRSPPHRSPHVMLRRQAAADGPADYFIMGGEAPHSLGGCAPHSPPTHRRRGGCGRWGGYWGGCGRCSGGGGWGRCGGQWGGCGWGDGGG